MRSLANATQAHLRDCAYKQAFSNRLTANRACETVRRTRQKDGGLKIAPYRCLVCNHWHLGHSHPPRTSATVLDPLEPAVVDPELDWQDVPVEPGLLARYAHRFAGYPLTDLNLAF